MEIKNLSLEEIIGRNVLASQAEKALAERVFTREARLILARINRGRPVGTRAISNFIAKYGNLNHWTIIRTSDQTIFSTGPFNYWQDSEETREF
jgi:hypothetical protein